MTSIENEFYDKLKDIVKKGGFPDYSFEMRHLDRVYIVSIDGEGKKVQFEIERHPHLFGRPSKGSASSAFTCVLYTYELDMENNKVSLIREDMGETVIDYDLLIDEEIYIMGEGGFFLEEEVEKLLTEEEVKMFGEKEFNKLNFTVDLEYLPKYSHEKYLRELKSAFLIEMISRWECCRENEE